MIFKNRLTQFFNKFSLFIQAHFWWWLVLLACLSLFLKILAFCVDPVVGSDGSFYCLMAQTWYKTGSYQAMLQEFSGTGWIPPGFLWCLKSLLELGLPVAASGVGLNIFFGISLVPVGYGLAWEITRNKKIALITAAFLAVHPQINDLSVEITRDMSYFCLQGVVLWSALAGIRRKSLWYFCLSGFLSGINFLVRYESVECIPLIGIVLLILVIKRQFPWKKALLFGIVWFGLFVFSFSLWAFGMGKRDIFSAYNRYFTGKITVVSKHLQAVGKGK